MRPLSLSFVSSNFRAASMSTTITTISGLASWPRPTGLVDIVCPKLTQRSRDRLRLWLSCSLLIQLNLFTHQNPENLDFRKTCTAANSVQGHMMQFSGVASGRVKRITNQDFIISHASIPLPPPIYDTSSTSTPRWRPTCLWAALLWVSICLSFDFPLGRGQSLVKKKMVQVSFCLRVSSPSIFNTLTVLSLHQISFYSQLHFAASSMRFSFDYTQHNLFPSHPRWYAPPSLCLFPFHHFVYFLPQTWRANEFPPFLHRFSSCQPAGGNNGR